MSVIETNALSKRYSGGLRGEATLAVDQITFGVEPGQIFGFLGPNGSGKTSTIGMLLGIISPSAGTFRLFGESTPRGIHSARQRIGATLEYPNFYPYLSCRDNLKLVASVKGRDPKDVDEALEVVGLTKRQKTRFEACSLGMKQRLALGATLLGDPELIILDEPSNGLDPAGQREIRGIIQSLGERGKTIFLSSHILHEVERTCTHVAIIEQGRLVRQASVSEITTDRVVVGLRSDADLEVLRSGAAAFLLTKSATSVDDRVVVELEQEDLAGLNAFLASRGIFLSHLVRERQTLESVFMELTSERSGFGEVS